MEHIALLSVSAAISPLDKHLISLNAPRAAARLGSAQQPTRLTAAQQREQPHHQPPRLQRFSVSSDHIRLVDTAAAAKTFVDDVAALLRSEPPLSACATVALDAEWRPDAPLRSSGKSSNHEPSLLQLATADRVWLLDLEQPLVVDHPARPLLAIANLLASPIVRILGFSLLTDLNKLQLLCTPSRGFARGFTLSASRVVDLREACHDAASARGAGEASSGAPREGLSANLARWVGVRLDKAMQCSDWVRRPLSRRRRRWPT